MAKVIMTVKINPRKIWELGKGHATHRGGSGTHDNRPNRQRTRGAANKRAIRDHD
jgi:hypothetical protein